MTNRPEKRTCQYCGREFVKVKYQTLTKYCSQKCRYEAQKERSLKRYYAKIKPNKDLYDKLIQNNKRYVKNNRDKINAYQRAYRKKSKKQSDKSSD